MNAHASQTAVQLTSEPVQEVVRVEHLAVKVFADGADKASILELSRDPLIKGFTTNPTLMRMANVTNYEEFARDILSQVADRPISFEVFSDDVEGMYRQARKIAGWGDNVYVKIPITNTRRESTTELIRRLSGDGVKVNVTAIQTVKQVQLAARSLVDSPAGYVSVFAGRIADTGRDPIPTMLAAVEILGVLPQIELIWASPREVLNVVQADKIGCDIITMTHALLTKLPTIGRDLDDFSLETVRMFYSDGQLAGFNL
jgi:transaldolase